jgi:hypothetical protein
MMNKCPLSDSCIRCESNNSPIKYSKCYMLMKVWQEHYLPNHVGQPWTWDLATRLQFGCFIVKWMDEVKHND